MRCGGNNIGNQVCNKRYSKEDYRKGECQKCHSKIQTPSWQQKNNR